MGELVRYRKKRAVAPERYATVGSEVRMTDDVEQVASEGEAVLVSWTAKPRCVAWCQLRRSVGEMENGEVPPTATDRWMEMRPSYPQLCGIAGMEAWRRFGAKQVPGGG